ncbi:MAG: AI-2E family transporter [Actinomycetota bacterium]|nr:AI-2E family transporter [Actinomycetota bacterium]
MKTNKQTGRGARSRGSKSGPIRIPVSPRVYGQAVQVHPIVVLLAVVGGGQISGPTGAILAVPMLAVLRVLLDFLRPRLYVRR